MAGLDLRIYGANFDTVKEALVSLYFKYQGITPAALTEARK